MHEDLRRYVVYRCITGSRAYGLATENSDFDVRGCYLPPARMTWSMHRPPEQLVRDADQECFWEFEKMIKLALKSNPNVLECLNTPLVEFAAPIGEQLLAIRETFPSQLAVKSYLGYADAQFARLQNAELGGRPVKWKHAMHLIRLMISGLHLLTTGRVLVDVSAHRDLLLSIKEGGLSWPQIETLRSDFRSKIEGAAVTTVLPAEPDWQPANELLIRARRSMVDA